MALISRLGWKRAGTRFNTRGVDDDGNCANFVEVLLSTASRTARGADCRRRRKPSSAPTSTVIVTYKYGVAFHVCTPFNLTIPLFVHLFHSLLFGAMSPSHMPEQYSGSNKDCRRLVSVSKLRVPRPLSLPSIDTSRASWRSMVLSTPSIC